MIYIHEEFDTEEEAVKFRDRYYRSYHPAGYGTRIKITQDETTGKWIASGSRGSTAD